MSTTTTASGAPDPDDSTSTSNVFPLRPTNSPATEPGNEIEPSTVIQGEILTEEESAELDRRRMRAAVTDRVERSTAAVVRGVVVVRTVATHDRTVRTGKWVLRHTLYLTSGTSVVVRRVWDSRTTSRYERMMRAAEIAGDTDAVAAWEERAERFKDARHRRAMDWLDAPVKVVRATAVGAAGLTGALTGIGIVLAVSQGDVSAFLDPFSAVLAFVRGVVFVVSVVWGPLLLAAPWVGAAYLWNTGRRVGDAPAWLVKPGAGRDVGAPVTPSRVVTALRDLGIKELRDAIKKMDDSGASLLGPIVIAGRGVEVDVTLPSGVNTAQVQGRRRALAENLDRHEHELFISIPPAARTVRLWIADSGALDEPIGPSPLVVDETLRADLYTGRAPWGEDLRGDAAAIALLQRHLLITGLSNQGKTAALRALALWLALDISVEFRIADLKGIGDWHMFHGLASILIEGPTDEHVIAATEMLEEGVREMERRLAAVDPDTHKNGVDRDLARSGQGFHPLFLVVDEAQQAFMCPAIGEDKRPYGGSKSTSRYFMAARKLHNQGRAVNVILWQGTQNPTDQNLPKLVREGAHIRASLVVGTESEARMALGDKAINGGAAPHKLRQGMDKGTLVVAGDGVPLPSGQSSITIRTHFIDGDEATTIAERAKQQRGRRTTNQAADRTPPRDLLADVEQVMGDEPKVRTEIARQRLAELHPATYEGMSATDFTERLADRHVEPYKSNGYMTLRLTDIRRAITDSDHTGGG
ncbi:ATP-binding protein [Umezawaea beigongshangensis]|uniref:ATP-binding protein n=1 Tax=Umezawaea beigongshangensis TaxID=2780383 RepID=UPI0018F148A0|nr:ATP-binding protein [Umezawaea beigongshangensis]